MSEPNSAYDDILQDLKNALAREKGLLSELQHANDPIARLTAILKQAWAERKIHGKCSCWRCLGCISDPYADDEIGPENPKEKP